MNNVALIGRLTNDPEIRGTEDKRVATFTLAVDRRGKDTGADFIRCAAFKRTAEFVERYLSKGMKIGAVGSIHADSYTDREGRKVHTTEVYINDAYFCEPRSNAREGGEKTFYSGSPINAQDGFIDAPDGVPFR